MLMEEAKVTQPGTVGIITAQIYTAKDTHIVENPQKYSTLGKAVLSDINSQPIWSFGKSTRKDMEKVAGSAALSKVQFMGKASPGPVYDPKSSLSQSRHPSWGFPAEERLGPTQPPYDHYEIVDKGSDPAQAKRMTEEAVHSTKFGSGGRVTS